MITKFMEVMFSNTDEDLAKQVDSDIKEAAEKGEVDTEELKYEKTNDGVLVTDKVNGGEKTLVQKSDEADTYDLVAVQDEQLEGYLHPEADGKTPGNQEGAPDEKKESHEDPAQKEAMGLNPEAGHEATVEENAEKAEGEVCPECGEKAENCKCEKHEDEEEKEAEDEKNFSVQSDNAAFQKIFSYPQEFVDRLFSEVIESAETAKVGDIKVEKDPENEDSVIVTSISTGDQAKVTLDDEKMEVQELDTKEFSGEGFMPLYIIGVQPYDHIIVDAQAYSQEAAEVLEARLTEDGVEAVKIFDNQDDAREYAIGLLESLGADYKNGDVDEPELEKEFSDATIYTTAYRTGDSVLMSRLFSEHEAGVSEIRDAVEEAMGKEGAQEISGMTITPIDATTAIVEDGGEHTKVSLNGEDMELEKVDAEEAEAMISEGEVNAQAEEKEFCWTNEAETRFFSEGETLTAYMERLFSEEADQNYLEEAIEDGTQIENDTEIITPVDDKTAVVQDKENNEFTKVTILDEDRMNVHPISEEEAENLMEDVEVGEEEKEFSQIYTNEAETRFFSESEEMTSYMQRIFSEEADQDKVEEAIEKGEVVEDGNDVITPIDDKVAIIEDTENGEFTKAEVISDDDIEMTAISEEEAKELKGEEEKKEEEAPAEKEDEQKEFSVDYMSRFFAEVAQGTPVVAQAAPAPAVAVDPNAVQAAPAQEAAPAPTIENIEDKALAAIQSIKAAVEEGTAQILEAKAAPAPDAEPAIQEAQFSEKTFSQNDTLLSWLNNK